MRKIAIIINGDTENRHLKNVEQSLNVLEAQGYETFVASTKKPGVAHDHYSKATVEGFRELVNGARRMAGDDSDLVLYVTGHGGRAGDEATVVLADAEVAGDAFSGALDSIPYKRRTVIMDQCYGGNWAKVFVDDPRSLFVSTGSTDEQTCCNEFAPYFWAAEVPDQNHDGTISWQERFAYAVSEGETSTAPKFSPAPGYADDGKRPFSDSVKTLSDMQEYRAEISKLKPGQYAVVMLSMGGCGACDEFEPEFRRVAREAGGQHAFIEVTDSDVASDMYGIHSFPTVVVVDHSGRASRVNRNSILAGLAQAETSGRERRREELVKNLQRIDELATRAIVFQSVMDNSGLEGEMFDSNDVKLRLLFTMAKMEEGQEKFGDMLLEVETTGQMLREQAFGPVVSRLKKAASEDNDDLANLTGWVILSEALNPESGGSVHPEVLLEVFKHVSDIAPTRVAFELLLERKDWERARKCVEFSQRRYNHRCNEALGEAMASTARRTHELPADLAFEATKNVSTSDDVLSLFDELLKQKEWGRVKKALEYARENYNDLGNETLADRVAGLSDPASIPADVLVQAFKSARDRDTALGITRILLDSEAGEAEIQNIRRHSREHYKEKFHSELIQLIESHKKDDRPAKGAGSAGKDRPTISLTDFIDY